MENTMKTSIATALSVVGVLAAGTAAYAVNTSVLGAAAADTPSIVSVAPTSTDLATPIAKVTNAAVVAQQSETSETTTTYKVGDAGTVVLSNANGAIKVVSILPAAGFTSKPAYIDEDGHVEIEFISARQKVEFEAHLENGVIVTDVESEFIEIASPSNTTPQRGYNDDDDDDRDEHHDEDHKDREDHDEEGDDD